MIAKVTQLIVTVVKLLLLVSFEKIKNKTLFHPSECVTHGNLYILSLRLVNDNVQGQCVPVVSVTQCDFARRLSVRLLSKVGVIPTCNCNSVAARASPDTLRQARAQRRVVEQVTPAGATHCLRGSRRTNNLGR
jgi:hypothetical protein